MQITRSPGCTESFIAQSDDVKHHLIIVAKSLKVAHLLWNYLDDSNMMLLLKTYILTLAQFCP